MRVDRADLSAVCRRMRVERRVAVTVHENPDVDAFGSAAGLLDLFAQLGVDGEFHADLATAEAPPEGFIAAPVHSGLPGPDVPLYALDCGARTRIALPLEGWEGEIINIDHHADNDGFGTLALVDAGSSSTSEIVCEIAQALGLKPSGEAATALYAGLSFDTGHFRHSNTSARTFSCASRLLDLGVDATAVYARLYERRSLAATRLWAHAVAAARPVADGRAMVAVVTSRDYEATGASEHDTEGIVESLRATVGVEAAALIREQTNGGSVRVSLRSDTLDVSAVAALRGGGGHRLAAGFSSDDDLEEVAAWLSSELERRLSTASF